MRYQNFTRHFGKEYFPSLTNGPADVEHTFLAHSVCAEILYKHVPEEYRNLFNISEFAAAVDLKLKAAPGAPLNDAFVSLTPTTYEKLPKEKPWSKERYSFREPTDGKTIEVTIGKHEYGFGVGNGIAKKFRVTEKEIPSILKDIFERIASDRFEPDYFNLVYDVNQRSYIPRK